jgi:c-di-GMP-binding flagellar brake protein YcgR
MFKKAASLWKRLVAHDPSKDPAGQAPNEERRVWVRFPARTDALVRPAGTEGTTLISAKVLDVSLGGVKLVVDRRFEPGALISLDLPGGDDPNGVSVLACVVRAEEQPNGEWVLGCNFSRELNAADLQRFGIAKAKPVPPDQRSWSRIECNIRAAYLESNADKPAWHEAQVGNISAGGVALIVDRDVPNGMMLTLDLLTSAGEQVTTILACVVHISALPDGRRVLGCNFICELSEEHLTALLFEPARAS